MKPGHDTQLAFLGALLLCTVASVNCVLQREGEYNYTICTGSYIQNIPAQAEASEASGGETTC